MGVPGQGAASWAANGPTHKRDPPGAPGTGGTKASEEKPPWHSGGGGGGCRDLLQSVFFCLHSFSGPLHGHLSTHPKPTHLFTLLPIHPPSNLSTHPPTYPPTHPTTHLHTHASIPPLAPHPSIHPSTNPPTCPSPYPLTHTHPLTQLLIHPTPTH